MGRTRVLVEISSSRLEMAAVRGSTVVARRSLRSEQADWGTPWPECLTGLAVTLRGWVRECGLAGAEATVLYGPSGAAAGVFSCPSGVGAAGAEQAAVLALQEVAGFAVREHPHDCDRLCTDGAGAERKVHTLSAADRSEHVSALNGMIAAAGLKAGAMMPVDACIMSAVVRRVRENRGAGVCVALWIGEHASVLAAAGAGRLRFIRSLAVGIESLADGLCRPLRPKGASEAMTIPRGQARQMLARHGIPRFEDAIDAGRGIDGACVLPVLQPVLQRLGVELKQSLRFGLDENERNGVQLVVMGPGAQVPRLGEAVAQQCGATLASEGQGTGVAGDIASVEYGALGLAAAGMLPEIDLLPSGVAMGAGLRRARRALWTGIGAAACLAGGGAAWLAIDLAEERAMLKVLLSTAQATAGRLETAAAARTAQDSEAAMKSRIGKSLGDATDWSAVLWLLAIQTPEGVRLVNIDLVHENEGPRARIVGHVVDAGDRGFAETLKRYAKDLGACPLVSMVTMGATGRVEILGRPAHRFELTLSLVGVPQSWQTAQAKGGE